MSQLLTQCPSCQTSFKVTEKQIQAANGVVRCGVCMDVFLARQHRIVLKDWPEEAQSSLPERFDAWHDDNPETGITTETTVETDVLIRDETDADVDSLASLTPEESPEDDLLNEDTHDSDPGEELDDDPQRPTDDTPASEDSAPPYFGSRLNPSGYRLSQFDASCEPPGPEDPDDETAPDTSETSADDTPPADIEQEVIAPAVAPEAEPAMEQRIPTLVPDVVASESIPASLGTQTLAWLRSLRGPAADADESPVAGDEKALYRQHLTGLQYDDSLEALDEDSVAAIDEVIDEDAVELVSEDTHRKKLRALGLSLLSILLLAGLAGQALWFSLPSLLENGRLTAMTGVLCSMVDCPVPQTVNLSNLVTEELVVRSHPDAEDALQVNFIFRNDANREQLFPDVQLNFTDNSGRIVAGRVFSAEEYLPSEMQLFTHMPAHSSIQVSLDLVDPGDEATGYSLEFHNP